MSEEELVTIGKQGPVDTTLELWGGIKFQVPLEYFTVKVI